MRAAKAFWVQADSRRLPYPVGHFHCAVTSPPYFGQRAYGEDAAEVGQEESPTDYVAAVADVLDDTRRVMRDDGLLFLNVGDAYRDKELLGMPWLLAFELKRRGWILRSENIWAKSIAFGDRHAANIRTAVVRAARRLKLSKMTAEAIAEAVEPQVGSCMPGGGDDRCVVSHEQVFMFAKSRHYFSDFEAVKERGKDWGDRDRTNWKYRQAGYTDGQAAHSGCEDNNFAEKGRQLRSVWTINTQPVHGMKHYAAYPVRLVEPCIKIGTSPMGCCVACGAPLERIVEKTKTTRERPNEFTKRTGEDGTGNACANTVDGTATRTVGWRGTCTCDWDCEPEPTVPCRVLDPFGGIGTTAKAGVPLGCDVHIVDLYSKYLTEGEHRFLHGDPPRPARRRKTVTNTEGE